LCCNSRAQSPGKKRSNSTTAPTLVQYCAGGSLEKKLNGTPLPPRESVKARGKDVHTWTWLFQAMTARQRGKHDEARRLLARFEAWRDRQTFPTWQQRVSWNMVLREARRVVHGRPQ
jgi:hypothetical protein